MSNTLKQIPRSRGRPRKEDARSPEQRKQERLAHKQSKASDGLALLVVAPDSSHVRRHTVLAALSVSETTLWRRIKENKFPAPKFDGRLAFWTAGQVRAALAEVAK